MIPDKSLQKFNSVSEVSNEWFSDEALQHAHRMASLLHNNKEIVDHVFAASVERGVLEIQSKKKQTEFQQNGKKYKHHLHNDNLLQYHLLKTSEIRERDQESIRPRQTPKYIPKKNDLLIRYIKKLIYTSYNRRSRYSAIGLGTLLYRYKTTEIVSLSPDYFDSENSGKIKKSHITEINNRFPSLDITDIYVPNESERELVNKALLYFAPIITTYNNYRTQDDILETYFGMDSNKSEWERVEILLNGGLTTLVDEYNKYHCYTKNKKQLESPENKLMIPNFNKNRSDENDDDNPITRFDVEMLSPGDLSMIKAFIEQRNKRRNNKSFSKFRIFADDVEVAEIFDEGRSNLSQSCSIPAATLYVDIIAKDNEGDLRLATFSVPDLSDENLQAIESYSIIHEQGLNIRINFLIPTEREKIEKIEIEVEIKSEVNSQFISVAIAPTISEFSFQNDVEELETNSFDYQIRPKANWEKPNVEPNLQPQISMFMDQTSISRAKIKVIGVGGGGCNAVNGMIEMGIKGIEFIAVNTDIQALEHSKAPIKIQLGSKLTRGLGAGADPMVGRDAALEDHEKILDVLEDSDMVFVTTGLGGGTGTGAAPVIAALAIELGALTIAVVTKPFTVEGKKRMMRAESGLAELRGCVDTIITIPNSKLKEVEEKITITEAFHRADNVLMQAILGISNLINIPGTINLDFADVKSVMKGMGVALMGVGHGKGENAAVKAMKAAIDSKLLEENSIKGARGALINFTGSKDMPLDEIEKAIALIQEEAHEDSNIIFGTVFDEEMGDAVTVTVIATGLEEQADFSIMSEIDVENYNTNLTSISPPIDTVMNNSIGIQESVDISTFIRRRAD